MYVYFDQNGTLKEIISDKKFRVGDSKRDKIYVYWEGEHAPISGWVKYRKPNGKDYPVSVEECFFQLGQELVGKELPNKPLRNLKYFSYDHTYEENGETKIGYKFYEIVVPDAVLNSSTDDEEVPTENNMIVARIRFVMDDGQTQNQVDEADSIETMGALVFSVETNIGILTDSSINETQYNYLVSLISMKIGYGTRSEKVASLPQVGSLNVIYYVEKNENGIVYDAYFWNGEQFVYLGTTSYELYTKQEGEDFEIAIQALWNAELADYKALMDGNWEQYKVQMNSQMQNYGSLIQSAASGSPKGTFQTLTSLQNAYPTGTSGIYVVVADGKWYYWNSANAQWTAGGQYLESGISDDLELLNKINLVDISVAGKYNDLVIGSYINSSGAITGTGDYYRRYVYNEPNFKYIKFGGYGATSVSAIAFYNSTEITQGNLISAVVYPSGHNDAIYEDYAEIPSNCKCVVFSTRTDKGSYYVFGTILEDIEALKESVSNLNDICYVDNGEEYGTNVTGKYIAVNGTDTGTGNYYQETIFNNPKFKCIKAKGCGNVTVSALAFYNSTTISSANLIGSIPYPYGYNETPYEITAKVPENCACVVFSTRNDRGAGTYYVKPSFEITQDKEESENLQLVVHIEQGGVNTTNLSSSNAIPAGTILKVVVASIAEGTAVQDIRMFNSSDGLNNCVVMTDTVGTFYLKANTIINRIYSAQSTRNIEYYVYKVMSPQVAFKNDLIYPVKAHNQKKTLQKGDLIFKNEYWYYNNGAYKGYENPAYLSTQLFLKDAKNLKVNFADKTGKSFKYTIQRFFGGSKTNGTGWITNASQTIPVDGCENVVIMLRIDGSTFVDLDDLKGIDLSIELESFVEDYVGETSMVKHLNEANRSFKQFPFNFGKQIGHLFINQAFSSNSQTIPCQSIYDVDAQKRMGFKVIHSNCKPTATTGKYVMCHGSGNYLGDQFEGLNGANPATTNVTTSTFDYLRENFIYKSQYVKYKKPITELEEWLKQVKRCNAIPCVQYVDEEQVKIIEKYFPTDYILYGGNRSVTKSWIYTYFSNLTAENYKMNLSIAISVEGLPLIIAIQHADRFTDAQLLDMANFTHENGAYIGIAGCYEQDNQTERCYRAGFDFNISGYEVNQFEDGNIANLTDFEEFGTDGTILSDGTLKLEIGQKISFDCTNKGFVNKAGVKIIFSGKINVSCGAYNGTNIVNDGKQTSWFSSFIIDDYPAFSITAVEDTIITDIKFVASKC